jgi:hypothetical protein
MLLSRFARNSKVNPPVQFARFTVNNKCAPINKSKERTDARARSPRTRRRTPPIPRIGELDPGHGGRCNPRHQLRDRQRVARSRWPKWENCTARAV